VTLVAALITLSRWERMTEKLLEEEASLLEEEEDSFSLPSCIAQSSRNCCTWSTVEGVTVEGVTVEGVTVEGVTVEGVTVEGVTVEGVTVEGVTVHDCCMPVVLPQWQKRPTTMGKETCYRLDLVERDLLQTSTDLLKAHMYPPPLLQTSTDLLKTSTD